MQKLFTGSKYALYFSGLLLVLFIASGCGDKAQEQPVDPDKIPKVSLEEGSGTDKEVLKQAAARQVEGSGGEVKDHPAIQRQQRGQAKDLKNKGCI